MDGWLAEGRELAEREARVSWAIGDWWARGDHAYGDRAKLGVELFAGNLSYSTLRNLGSIARNVEPSRRRDSLSWSHHAEVAPLPGAEQDEWLGRADSEGWSVRQFRAELEKGSDIRKIDGPCMGNALLLAPDEVKAEVLANALTPEQRAEQYAEQRAKRAVSTPEQREQVSWQIAVDGLADEIDAVCDFESLTDERRKQAGTMLAAAMERLGVLPTADVARMLGFDTPEHPAPAAQTDVETSAA